MKIGDAAYVNRGIYTHWGIVVSEHPYIVRSLSKGRGIINQSLEEFGDGRRVYFRPYQGGLTREQVVYRALTLPNREWSLDSNCEHFVNWAQGNNKGSPQLFWLGVAALAFGLFALRGA